MRDNQQYKDIDVYSKSVRAGKRTYFFDVKKMSTGEKYLVITESKKVFNQDNGSFDYDKHKIFLYKEDYDNFANTLENIIEYIRTGADLQDEIKTKLQDKQNQDD